jgi:hypothetical protein
MAALAKAQGRASQSNLITLIDIEAFDQAHALRLQASFPGTHDHVRLSQYSIT